MANDSGNNERNAQSRGHYFVALPHKQALIPHHGDRLWSLTAAWNQTLSSTAGLLYAGLLSYKLQMGTVAGFAEKRN